MDRRYICDACGMKWFVPASRTDHMELTECAACGGPLGPFPAHAPPDAGPHPGSSGPDEPDAL